MILVLAPYPTLERVALVSSPPDPDAPPRPTSRARKPMQIRLFAGGGGLRAATVTQMLGGDPFALTLGGGRTGTLLTDRLDAQGVAHRVVTTAAPTRGSLLTLDREKGVQGNVPENPTQPTEAEATKFYAEAEALLPTAQLVLVGDGGEAGTEADKERLATFLRAAHSAEVPALCDGGGVSLDAAEAAGAWLVRIGLHKLQRRTERSLQHDSAIIAAAQEVRERSVANVLVTLGDEGALLVTGEGAWRIKAPVVSYFNSTGSGETFSGALATRYVQSFGLLDAARYGCAAASVNVTHDEPGFATQGEVAVLYPRTMAIPVAGKG